MGSWNKNVKAGDNKGVYRQARYLYTGIQILLYRDPHIYIYIYTNIYVQTHAHAHTYIFIYTYT